MENPWTAYLGRWSDPAGKATTDVEIVLGLLNELEIGSMLLRRALTNRLGITETDYLVLDLLIRRGALAGSQLSGVTGLSSAAVTQLAARLEREGLLLREPDPHDGRRRLLYPTAEAVDHIASTLDELQMRDPRRVTSELLNGLDDAGLAAVTTFLSRAADRAFRGMRALRTVRREPSRWRSRGSSSPPAPPRSAPA